MPDDIRVEDAGGVRQITLNRPEARNSLHPAMIRDLTGAMHDAARAPGVRVVVLAAAGTAFCAGAEIASMRRQGEASDEENLRDAQQLAGLFRSIAACPRPVVARVQGPALGGGAGLVAAADFAVASQEAVIGFPEVRLGIIPATIAPHVVLKIGAGQAAPLFLRGRVIDAMRGLALGLFTEVVPAGELDTALDALVHDLMAGAPGALRAAKTLVSEVSGSPAEVDRLMADRIAAARRAPEGREGLQAFLEKRRPMWTVEEP